MKIFLVITAMAFVVTLAGCGGGKSTSRSMMMESKPWVLDGSPVKIKHR